MEFDPESYKPLPLGLTIKESKIHGLGLFTKVDLRAGKKLGITHIKVSNLYIGIDEWVRTPLGGFINHSENPNTFMVKEKIKGSHFNFRRILYTVKPIKAGYEITSYYTLLK